MWSIFRITLITCICYFAISSSARADNIYLYLQGIPGEALDIDHKDWIDIERWEWQVSGALSFEGLVGGGGTPGRALVRPLVVSKRIDKSSPLLTISTFDGRYIPSAILDVTASYADSGRFTFLRITLENVVVSNVSYNVSSDDGLESVALIFTKICYRYYPVRSDGSPLPPIETCWDLQANTEG